MAGHARLGPSNHRWPKCPGSVREEAQYEDVPGKAAIDGTGSHLLLELCLDNNVRAEQYDGQIIGANDPENPMGWLVAPDRIERVQMCLDYVARRHRELTEQFPGCFVVIESETKADPGGYFGRDDWWGTVDITITAIDPETDKVLFLEVCDYKDGRGWVEVGGNTQLISYTAGKIRPYVGSGPDLVRPFKTQNVGGCRMSIVQPKTNPAVRYEDLTTVAVMDKTIDLSVAAGKTDDSDAPCIPGPHCLWCKANPKRGGHCTANAEKSLETVKTMTTDIAAGGSLFEQMGQLTADPVTMTPEQLSELYSAKDALVAAFDRIGDEIKHRIDTGVKIPGYAMVPGKSSRVWNTDEDAIAKALKGRRLKNGDIYPAKLISVAQVMKLPKDKLTDAQKAKIEKDLVTNVAGKLSLKKVEHEVPLKDVVQSDDNVVQSDTQLMFADVPQAAAPADDFSFI